MVNKLTSAELVIKPLQWIEETVEGQTPATGSMVAIGINSMISVDKENNFVEVPQLSMEDLVGLVTGQRKYKFQIKYNPINSTFLKYGFNPANYGAPAGTISASLTLLISCYFNGVENFILINGLRIDNTTIKHDVGKPVEITMDCIGTMIQAPTTTAPLGITLITATPAGPAWDWLSGGTNPVTDGGIGQNCKSFTVTVARTIKEEYILGSDDPMGTLPHARRVTFSGDFIWNGLSTLEADRDTATLKTMTMVLKSALSTITLTNAGIDKYSRSHDIGQSEAIFETITGKATSVAVT